VFCSSNSDLPIGGALETYGQWSYEETLIFQQVLRPGDTVVDAGANIGMDLLFYAFDLFSQTPL
jgi:hypothetical protein